MDDQVATAFEPELEQLREHEREGLVRIGEDLLEATPTGELFVRNLALCFDRYQRTSGSTEGGAPVFSRTV